MTFNFDERIDRHHSDSAKWNKYPENVLPMWVADTDFRSPPCVIDALINRVQHGIFGYSSAPDSLAQVIVNHLKNAYGWEIKTEWIVFLPGIVSGLNLSVRAFTGPEQSSITPLPIYPPFRKAAKFAGRAQINTPLKNVAGRLVYNLPALEASLSGQERLLMLCNPQNPGGTVATRDELIALNDFARRHDLIVCSDEIHCDLILEPGLRHIPYASLSEDAARRSVTLMSTSKTFNIPGLGASWAIVPDAGLRQRFNTTRQGIVPSVNTLALVASEAALREGQNWLEALRAYLKGNRDRLAHALAGIPELKMINPQATYLAWVDASGLGVDNPARFFQQAGLGFSPGEEFGQPQWVRINFGCTRETLETAIQRITIAVQQRG